MRVRMLIGSLLVIILAVAVRGQQGPPPPEKAIPNVLNLTTKQVLDMAEDFPAEKYEFKATPEVRSFREVIVHAMSGTAFAAKIARGEQAQWDEIDPKGFKDKASVVAEFKKIASGLDAALKALPATRFASSPQPFLNVIEHTGEHYGQLVVYYRLNKMVPPASRPKK